MLYNECAIHHKTKIQPLWSAMVMLLMDIGCGDDAEVRAPIIHCG